MGGRPVFQVACPKCSRVVDYSGDRLRLCACCGSPLGDDSDPQLRMTASFDSGASPLQAETLFEPDAVRRRDVDPGTGRRLLDRPPARPRGGMGSRSTRPRTASSAAGSALKLIAAADHVTSRRGRRAVPPRGPAGQRPGPPALRVRLGGRRGCRPAVHRHGADARRDLAVARRGGKARCPLGDAIAKTLDVIEGLQEGRHPGGRSPRRQAFQLLSGRRRPRQGRRLRPVQVARRRRRPDLPDQVVRRHAAVRLARADQARRRGRPDGRLLGRRDLVLPADVPTAVPGAATRRRCSPKIVSEPPTPPRKVRPGPPRRRSRRPSSEVWSATATAAGKTSAGLRERSSPSSPSS